MPELIRGSSGYVREFNSQLEMFKINEHDAQANWLAFCESVHRPDFATRLTPRTPASISSAEYMLPGMVADGGLGALFRDRFYKARALGIPSNFYALLYEEQKMQYIEKEGNGNFRQVIRMERLPAPKELNFKLMDSLRVKVNGAFGTDTIPIYLHPLSTRWTKLYGLPVHGTVYPRENNSDDRMWHNAVLGFGQEQINRQLMEQGVIDGIAFYNTNESAMVVSMLAAVDTLTKLYGNNEAAFTRAVEEIRAKDILTNHTLSPAAEGAFTPEQCDKFIFNNLVSSETGKQLRDFIRRHDGQLRLVELALYLAGKRNGVSADHARLAAKTLNLDFYSVPNGTFEEGWAEKPVHILKQYKVVDRFGIPTPDFVKQVDKISTDVFYEAKQAGIEMFRQYLLRSGRLDQFGHVVKLPKHPLIFSDARRYAEYKNRTIGFTYEKVLMDIFEHYPEAHMFISGKAHPSDEIGSKDLAYTLNMIADNELFRERIHFLPNWEPNFAQMLIGATSVWLNNPWLGWEACGTSGMKAGLNFALLVSTVDGFFAEIKPRSAFYAITGPSRSQEEVTSYYVKLNQALADARDPEFWAEGVRRLLRSNFLSIASGTRMEGQYLEMGLPR